MPDQTTQQLRTTKEMDKQLDGKLDKAGGEVSGELKVKANIQAVNAVVQAIHTESGVSMQLDATFAEPNIRSKRKTSNWRRHILPDADGTLMQVGDFGVGESINIPDGIKLASLINVGTYTQQMSGNAKLANGYPFSYAGTLIVRESGGSRLLQEYRAFHLPGLIACRSIAKGGIETAWEILYSTGNTTKDANGNLKAASPIIKVFADHIKLNDESEGVELEKLSTGRYKLKGTLGMNSDASWGGYHGGLVIPNGINNLPLVWADFKVEADGDIIIETHYRKYADLPPPVVLNRLITYPEFMDENGNELDSYTPCDIPNGHWIDVRVNMPSDSLYNQKQAEAQRLAEIEAERLAKEEAENAGM
nr:pyocin knob domain-containing protein [Providencia sp.]